MKRIWLLSLVFLSGCIDYTWEKSEVWVYPNNGTYCVTFKGEGWKDERPYPVDLRCGMSLQDALILRDADAKQLGAVAK
jgi:hypothetical protein